MNTAAPLSASASAVSAIDGSDASRAASASTGKPASTSASGPCITSAARVGFGMHAAGFLELQRRLVGDRRRWPAAQDVQRIVLGARRQCPSSRSRSPSRNAPADRQVRPAAPSSPVHSPRMASPATAEVTNVLVAATLFSVPGAMSIAWSDAGGERRAGRVGEGDGQRATVARALCHRDDVGALARLRDGDAGAIARASACRRRWR